MKNRIYLLIKIFEKEEHADAFLKKGEMYCRTLGDFRRIEDDEARGDVFEAVTDCHQPDQISVVLSYKDGDGIEHSFPLKDLAGPVIMQNNGFNRLNLFCMYSVKIPEFSESYDTEEERLRAVVKINAMLKEKTTLSDEAIALGNFAVVVYQVEDFIKKVKTISGELGFQSWNGAIKYYDPTTFHGSFKNLEAVFRKRDMYEHQSEYRFSFASNEPEGHRTITLGSIESIAFKTKTKSINGMLEVKLIE